MPFQRENTLGKANKGKGRKGFELEAKQYKAMLAMTDLYFGLLKKILTGKPTTEERMRFEDVRQAMGKIVDKLHANKSETKLEIEGEMPFTIIKVGKIEKVGETKKE